MADSYDVAIAGGGIGALTAAVHSARMGRWTLVVGGLAPGGLLLTIEQIEGMPGFPEGVPGLRALPMLRSSADDGAEFRMAEVEGLERDGDAGACTARRRSPAQAVVLATGARLARSASPARRSSRQRRVPLRELRRPAAARPRSRRRRRRLRPAGGLTSPSLEVIVLHRGDAPSAQATYREPALAHPTIRSARHRGQGDPRRRAITGVRTPDVTWATAGLGSAVCSSTSGSRQQ